VINDISHSISLNANMNKMVIFMYKQDQMRANKNKSYLQSMN